MEQITFQMKGITKRFPGTIVVDGVDFKVQAGEVHALMGENGAGKSTLMKTLAGSFTDYTGQILIQGKEVALHSPAIAIQNGIGMIYQELSLVKPLTIAENVLVGRLPLKHDLIVDKKAMVAETQRCLDRVGLTLDPLTPIEEISQHEAQLVEIAKVLWHNPAILVMDEPTRGVDIGAKLLIHQVIEKLAEKGKTVILISSDLPELVGLSDRIMIMRKGYFTREIMSQFNALVNKLGVYFLILIFIVLGTLLFQGKFLSAKNFLNIIDGLTLLGIVACGVAFVTYSGHSVDLSIPTTMAFSGIITIEALRFGTFLAILAGLCTGLIIGLINAFAVGKLRVNPIIWTVRTHAAQFAGMSALLTTTMPSMKTSIEALKAAGVRDQVKVLIGGAPVTQKYADDIGADIYAPDGPSAARKAKELL